ncbi:MAG: hypothetical protein U0452_10185 [Anaerolineae bacterium]
MTPSESASPVAPRSRKRRLGCTVLIILWFALLLVPCGLFYFAVQQEVTVPLGGAPGQELRVWLVMEPRTRGLGYSLGHVAIQTDSQLCVQTSTSYLLWAGRPENTVYCECYARSAADEAWTYLSSTQGACLAAPAP